MRYFATSLLFIIGLTVKADVPIFGNTTNSTGIGFGIAYYADESSLGGAVAFTPQKNLDVSSVTLWLADCDAQQGMGIDISIDSSNNFGLSPVFSSFSDTTNDGSEAAFTFASLSSGPTVLDAGNEYWLVVHGVNDSNPYQLEGIVTWVGGGALTGDAVYDGSESYFSGLQMPDSNTPAFTINTVPEPSAAALISISLLLGIICKGRSRLMLFHKRGG